MRYWKSICDTGSGYEILDQDMRYWIRHLLEHVSRLQIFQQAKY